MKYVFINSVAPGFGSTGRIVAETCRDLMAQGHECLVFYGRKDSTAEDIPAEPIGSRAGILLHGLESRILDNSGFGSRLATKHLVEQIRQFDPDVIWLHNIHGYYLHVGVLFDYLRTCGKEIHWMLHDCWAFTGHCAYFDYVGCDRWKTGCFGCPNKGEYPASKGLDRSKENFLAKKKIFTGIPDLSLTVPSHWLERRVRQSFLAEYPVQVQYHTVDETVFCPREGDFRSKHHLEGKFLLLGVASVWDRRKGLDDFIALSKLLDDRAKIVLIGLTPQQIQALPETILGLPRTSDVISLAEAYSAADLYLNPSTEETFGMTVLEAARCGTESVVYQDTACEEIAALYGGVAVPRGAEHLYSAVAARLEESK